MDSVTEYLKQFHVKLFADGADLDTMKRLNELSYIRGFTTNPTLTRKAGVTDYERFAREVIEAIPDKPISFEVFSDEWAGMERQAVKLAGFGSNVYVKVPITNTRGELSDWLVWQLVNSGVKVNVTAIMTADQVGAILPSLDGCESAFASVFAGRIADSGYNPVSAVEDCICCARGTDVNVEFIWASPRQVYDIVQADRCGCHIITVTPDILGKLHLLGKDLDEFSLETVQMFRRDAVEAGYTL